MPEDSDAADKHVLLVDDEQAFLEELALYLRRRGWTVTTSATPCEAMVTLDRHAGIAVVVTDVRIGSHDGFDLARRIRSDRHGRRAVSVVVMTGHGELAAGTDTGLPPDQPVLRKPLALPGFLAALDAALTHAREARVAPPRLAGPTGSTRSTTG